MIDQWEINDIAQKTAENDHTGALIELHAALGNRRQVRALEHLQALQDYCGDLPDALYRFRYERFYLPGIKQAKEQLDPTTFEKVHNAL